MTSRPCTIVSLQFLNEDGSTRTSWAVRKEPWDRMTSHGDFDSPEEATAWAELNGYTPDPKYTAVYHLEQQLDILGPYLAAAAIVDHFSIHQLVRFGLEFRRKLDDRVTAEDYAMDTMTGSAGPATAETDDPWSAAAVTGPGLLH